MDSLAALISNVGFPIAAFVLIYVMMRNELKEMRKTVEQNTLAITKLLTYMETVEGGEIDGNKLV
jgi:hypothetical protein